MLNIAFKPIYPNFKKCWALENLQPLEKIENLKKGSKLLNEVNNVDSV